MDWSEISGTDEVGLFGQQCELEMQENKMETMNWFHHAGYWPNSREFYSAHGELPLGWGVGGFSGGSTGGSRGGGSVLTFINICGPYCPF